MDNLTHQQLGYERTTCACAKCTAACETMPGALGPGDLQQIAEYVECDVDDPMFSIMWRASPGATVHNQATGDTISIPTIVPAQDERTGHCVWLEDGQCSIHPVAPFCCRNFSMCEGDPVSDDVKSMHMLSEISLDQEYQDFWASLAMNDLVAAPTKQRRAALDERIRQIDEAESQ